MNKRGFLRRRTSDGFEPLQNLLVLRILCGGQCNGVFLQENGYVDEVLADMLELPVSPYDRAEAADIMRRKLDSLEKDRKARTLPARTMANLRVLGGLMGLAPEDLEVLGFLLLLEDESNIVRAIRLHKPRHDRSVLRHLARAMGKPEDTLRGLLAPRGRLLASGLFLSTSFDIEKGAGYEFFSSDVRGIVLHGRMKSAKSIPQLGLCAPASTLAPENYPKQRDALDLLVPYLSKCLESGKRGVNVLLHGPPGTGKTELARLLAGLATAKLIEVPIEDESGLLDSKQRVGFMRAIMNLHRNNRSILLLDEAEDILGGLPSIFSRPTNRGRKAWFNQILETNQRPVIWITNDPSAIDSAMVRRFDVVVEVGVLPKAQREAMISGIVGKKVSEQAVRLLAGSEHIAPAVVARAHGVVRTLGLPAGQAGADAAICMLVRNTLQAQGHPPVARSHPDDLSPAHDPAYLNTDMELATLPETLRGTPSARICLHGPPGTGKTSFGHWLADALSMPLQTCKASDLIDKYLGQTERNMAGAFEAAREQGAVLLIDEVDSFLRDRARAVRSWELAGVNEMLVQMEQFGGIFIATTNRMEDLDPACLRRFDLKLGLDYLRPDQSARLLAGHCAHLGLGDPDPSALSLIRGLGNAAPGDFANAARQHRFRRFTSPGSFAEAVAAECAAKPGVLRPLGFLAGA